jgi:hypothetical protein
MGNVALPYRLRRREASIEDKILAACWRAERRGFKIIAHYCGLTLKDGIYVASDREAPACLPLEAVVLDEPSTGGFEADMARQLRVSPAWVSGFLAGFVLQPSKDGGREGYQEGAAFRMKYYGRERL